MLGFEGAELGDGGFVEQAEDDGEAWLRQLLRGHDVADNA
jgi:hypothetical protein